MIPDKDVTKPNQYGAWGYEGWACDQAIRTNNVDDVKEVIKRGYMDKNTETFDGYGMIAYAKKFKANDVAEYLASQGWEK